MIKKTTALLLAVLLLVSVTPVVAADNDSLIAPHASDYLSSCSIALTPEGNRKMTVEYVINATDDMTELGATKVQIQRYDDYSEKWVDYTPLAGSYSTNDFTHAGIATFSGTRGVEYRAVVYAYAKDKNGGDSRAYNGPGVYCL